MFTRLVRRYDQEERQSDAAVHWDTIRRKLLKAFAKQGARDFSEEDWLRLIHEGSSKTRFECCEDSQNSLTYFRATQGHSGGITIAPELMEHIVIPYHWKEFLFHRSCSFSIQSILENGLNAGGKQNREGRPTIFFTPLNPFGENPDEEVPRDDFIQFLRKCTITAVGNVIRMPFYWVKISRAQDQRIAILTDEVTCNNRTLSCAARLHLSAKEIEHYSKDFQPHDPRRR